MRLRIVTMASSAVLACVSLSAQGVNMSKTAFFDGTTHDIGGSRPGNINTPTATTITAGAGCKVCHAPHNGSLAIGGSQQTGTVMLWAANFPGASLNYGIYGVGGNMVKTPTALVGAAAGSIPQDQTMYSLLCLSCHDGVTGIYTTMKAANVVGGGTAASGSVAGTGSLGLSNDHPVNIVYDTSGPAGAAGLTLPVVSGSFTVVGPLGKLPLYAGTVQCATCHDPHNNSNTNYLRTANGSVHCIQCHN